MVQVFIVDFFLRIGKKVFFQNCQKALNSVMHWQISEFSTSRFFYPSSFFYSSDRARRDEQKTPYNLPSKGPLEFRRNF